MEEPINPSESLAEQKRTNELLSQILAKQNEAFSDMNRELRDMKIRIQELVAKMNN